MRLIGSSRLVCLLMLPVLFFCAPGMAEEEYDPFIGPKVENDLILVRLFPHSSDQMAAFYEARGFPAAALKKIKQACFITVHVENRSDDIIWLEPDRWNFLGARGPIQRYQRSHWNKHWDTLNLPSSKRATFGWTLLPEERDLRPGEPVGGNITLPRASAPFSVSARFLAGKEKRVKEIHVQFDNIHCPDNPVLP